MRHLPILALLLLASTPSLSHAQPAGERLIAPIPSTFKLAGQVPHDGAKIEVFVPANETIENWSEQIATQVRFNMASRTDLTALLHVIEQKWIEACKESPPITILPGKTNGYATSSTLMQCPRLPSTGKPEAIDRDKVKEMVHYMGTVTVCDSRTSEHPCPAR